MNSKLYSLPLIAAACLILAGCGGGSKAPTADDGAYKGVFVSTNDCATDKNLTFDICADAINSAIEAHTKQAPTYPSLRACAATEGANKCERDINQKFRPRLMAYLIIASKKPKGIPLYASPKGQAGFRSADKTLYLNTDLSLEFSREAKAAVLIHAGAGGKKSMF